MKIIYFVVYLIIYLFIYLFLSLFIYLFIFAFIYLLIHTFRRFLRNLICAKLKAFDDSKKLNNCNFEVSALTQLYTCEINFFKVHPLMTYSANAMLSLFPQNVMRLKEGYVTSLTNS